MVNRAFTPRALRAMEPDVRTAAEELARSLPDGEEIDLLAAFTEPLSVWAISSILGLPHERRADVRRWSKAAVASIGAVPVPERWLDNERDLLDFQQSMAAVLADQQHDAGPGLIGELAAHLAEDGTGDGSGGGAAGRATSPVGLSLLLTLLRELVVAGNETTGKFLAEALRLFGSDPAQWERVRADQDYARTLVEESLRLATPTQTVMREATTDTELGGVAVPAGTQLMVSLASANRDEHCYLDPDEFQADRAGATQHLAFGQGPHMCVGAGLARMESRVALEVLADHVVRIEMSAARPPSHMRSYILRGPLEMWGTVTRRPEEAAP